MTWAGSFQDLMNILSKVGKERQRLQALAVAADLRERLRWGCFTCRACPVVDGWPLLWVNPYMVNRMWRN